MCPPVHPEVDQVRAELGVDHPPHGCAHCILVRHPAQCMGAATLFPWIDCRCFGCLRILRATPIYREISRAERPLSTMEIAKGLNLHPSTVRLHLDKLARRTSSARPRTATAPSGGLSTAGTSAARLPLLGAEPEAFRLLSRLSSRICPLARGAAPRWPWTPAGSRHSTGWPSAPVQLLALPGTRDSCLRAVLEELSDMGFDPSLEAGPAEAETVAISFHRCPFRELAVRYPDLVCQLHRGITEGILEGRVRCLPGPRLRGSIPSPASWTPTHVGSGCP